MLPGSHPFMSIYARLPQAMPFRSTLEVSTPCQNQRICNRTRMVPSQPGHACQIPTSEFSWKHAVDQQSDNTNQDGDVVVNSAQRTRSLSAGGGMYTCVILRRLVLRS